MTTSPRKNVALLDERESPFRAPYAGGNGLLLKIPRRLLSQVTGSIGEGAP